MSSDEQSEKECPLCMEPLEIDDIDFYPCKCEYQICRFCWHRLRTDENGLCPACRQPYPENPANFKPLSTSDVLKIKSEKKQKLLQQRTKISESRKHLSLYRVLQKNLVYVVGLSSRVADPDILKKPEFFGKYGRILKVAVGTSSSANAPQSASSTAYVTYAKYEDALRAIQAVNNALLDGRTVRASLGTTKYCSSFLRCQPCHKPECMYLHNVADSEVSFTKDDMHQGKHAEYEKKLIEKTILKDKGQLERPVLHASTKRKHSHSKSRDRTGTLHTVSSTGALDRSGGKNLGYQRQQNRASSKSRSETPKFGSLISNNLSDSEKAVNSEEILDKGLIVVNSALQEPIATAIKEPQSVELPIVRCSSETVHCLKTESSSIPEEQPKLSYTRSRLSQWTAPDGAVNQRVEEVSEKKENIVQRDNWAEGVLKEPPVYPPETGPSSDFDWQRLLGLNLDESYAPETTSFSAAESFAPKVEHISYNDRPSRLSLHSDDDLGFDPYWESAKGLANLMEEEKEAEPLQPSIYSSQSTALSGLFSLSQQYGWSSVGGGTNDILRGPVESAFAPIPDRTPMNNCNVSTDYFTLSSLRFPAAGQPQSLQQHNLGGLQHSLHPFGSVATKPQLLNNQFTDPPPALPARYSQTPQKYPSYNQGSPLSPMMQQLSASPGTSQLNEWQEGLKALLPNVNVRFVPELNAAGYPTTRPSMTTQNSWMMSNQQSQQMQHHHHQQQQPSMHNYYGQPSVQNRQLNHQVNHQVMGSTSSQVPIMPLNSISQTATPQWLLPPPGFSHLSKR